MATIVTSSRIELRYELSLSLKWRECITYLCPTFLLRSNILFVTQIYACLYKLILFNLLCDFQFPILLTVTVHDRNLHVPEPTTVSRTEYPEKPLSIFHNHLPLVSLQITQLATTSLLLLLLALPFNSIVVIKFIHHMASLQFRYILSPPSPKLLPLPHSITRPRFSRPFPPHFPGKLRLNFSLAGLSGSMRRRGRRREQFFSICCSSKTGSQIERVSSIEGGDNDDERPPFDINLAVILAGFAFEAYTTPPVCWFFLLLFSGI